MVFIALVVDSKKSEYAVKIDLKQVFKFEIYAMSIYINVSTILKGLYIRDQDLFCKAKKVYLIHLLI